MSRLTHGGFANNVYKIDIKWVDSEEVTDEKWILFWAIVTAYLFPVDLVSGVLKARSVQFSYARGK